MDERLPDKELARRLRINLTKVHAPPADERKPIEVDRLAAVGDATHLIPLGFGVFALHKVRRRGLDPGRFDGSDHSGVHPLGLNELSGHHPPGRTLAKRRALRDHETSTARP